MLYTMYIQYPRPRPGVLGDDREAAQKQRAA